MASGVSPTPTPRGNIRYSLFFSPILHSAIMLDFMTKVSIVDVDTTTVNS